MMKIATACLLIVCVLWVLWILLLYIFQDRLVFPGAWMQVATGPLDRPGAEVLVVAREDGDIPAWFFTGTGASAQTPRGTVVLLHGNGHAMDDWFEFASAIAASGVHVLLPEYRGYGHAPGTPSQDALIEDVVAFRDRVAERPEVDEKRFVYYGRSIGAALGAQVALERPPAGLLLHTPPSSIAEYAWRYGAPPVLIRHPFRTTVALEQLSEVPILIIAHDRDGIVPASHQRTLKAKAPHAEFLELSGTHNAFSTESDRDAFHTALSAFIEKHAGSG